MVDSDKVEPLDAQLSDLRSAISDLGYQIDSYKTKTAAALGAGVFLLFLAALAAYDLIAGKRGVWLMVGITGDELTWLASGLGVAATFFLMVGFRRLRQTDSGIRARLDSMEREYAELVERRDGATNGGF
jgi:hypothetical protein